MYCPSLCRYHTCAGPQTTPYKGRWYRVQNGNMRNFDPTKPHGTAFAPKKWSYQKEATGMENSKFFCPTRCRYRTYQCETANYPENGAMYCPSRCRFRTYQCVAANYPPSLHQSNGYIKRKLRAWRVQKCISLVGADTYLPVRGRKLPRFMGGSIGPRMEVCESSTLPISMVPRLHQSNGYIKRKLRAWRVQKSIALVGADTVLFSAGPQTTSFYGG